MSNNAATSPNGNGVAVDPQLRKEIATEVNVSVLRRMDPNFRHVVQTASHATLYKWKGKEWERCDVDGTTFLYERASDDGSPNSTKYRILCINRRSPENFSHDVQRCSPADIEVVSDNTMITFPAKNGDIYGMWFYVPDELRPFHETLCAVASGKTVPALPHRRTDASGAESKGARNGTTQTRGRKKESPRRKARISPKNTRPAASANGANGVSQEHVSVGNGGGGPLKDNSLQRFFPNLQPTSNGVIGSVLPVPAHDAAAMERTQSVRTNGLVNGRTGAGSGGQVSVVNATELEKSTALPFSTRNGVAMNNERSRQPVSDRGTISITELLHQAASARSLPLTHQDPGYPRPVASSPGSVPIPPTMMGQVHRTVGQVHPSPMSNPVPAAPHIPHMPQMTAGLQGLPTVLAAVPPGVHPAHTQHQQVQMALLAHQHMQQHPHLRSPLLHPQQVFPGQLQDLRRMSMGIANGVQPGGIPVTVVPKVPVPTSGTPNNGIISPNGSRSGFDGNAGNAILGMLKSDGIQNNGARVEESKLVSPTEAVRQVASSIGSMKLQGSGSETLTKAEFRAVVQRMLSDQKLFDSAYNTYRSVQTEDAP